MQRAEGRAGMVQSGLQALLQGQGRCFGGPEYPRAGMDCPSVGRHSAPGHNTAGKCGGICHLGACEKGQACEKQGGTDFPAVEAPIEGSGLCC